MPGAGWPSRPGLASVISQRASRWGARLGDVLLADAGELGEAVTTAGADGRAVVVVAAEVPGLGDYHVWALGEDLRAGVDLAFGPDETGGPYLLACGPGRLDLLQELVAAWSAAAPSGAGGLARFARTGLEVGMLRSERLLRDEGDVAALLADPGAPAELRAALSSHGRSPQDRRV